MRTIRQIREDYNQNRSASDKLEQLVMDGLLDEGKLTLVRRALRENHKTLTNAEKNALLETINVVLSDIDISEFDDVELLDEAAKKDYLSKFDPRFKTRFPTDKEAPQIIILKRKAIRVFPDNAKVALYYAQGIDKYISIPFGEIGVGSVNEAVKVGQVVKHDDGDDYEWKGAQWVNKRTGKIAKRDVGAALKAKHFPAKPKQAPVKAKPEQAAMNTVGRDTIKGVKDVRRRLKGADWATRTGATIGAAGGLAVRNLTRAAAKDTVGGAKLMGKGAYAAYKRIRGMRKEEREPIENAFTEKLQHLREYTRELPVRTLDQTITDIATEFGGPRSMMGGGRGRVKPFSPASKPNVKIKTNKEPAEVTVRPMRKTTDPVQDGKGVSTAKRDRAKTATRKKAAETRKAKEAENIQAAIKKQAELKKLRDQSKTQTRKERVAARKKEREERKLRAREKGTYGKKPKRGKKGGLAGLGALAGGLALSALGSKGGAEDKSVTSLDPSLKANIETPGAKSSYERQLDILNRKAQQQFAGGQTMQEQLNTIEEAVEFTFEDGSVTVTPSMAKNMLNVYNKVNEENKKKIEHMMYESADSLKKFINFASRY